MLHASRLVNGGDPLGEPAPAVLAVARAVCDRRGWGRTTSPSWPVALYGFVLLMAGVAYTILARALVHRHGKDSPLGTALGEDVKGWLSLVIYASAIPLAFLNRWISLTLYFVVAVMWLIPDRRIERILAAADRRD